MNFSLVSGCPLACRFSRLNVIRKSPQTTKQFIYSTMLKSLYKPIIESKLPIDANIIYGNTNGPIRFSYRGVSESIHAVAVIDSVPHLVKVILTDEPIMIDTLREKYDSVYTSLQAMMALSDQGGNQKINKSIILAVDISAYYVTEMLLEADPVEQGNIKNKIDYILASDKHKIGAIECKQCEGCDYAPICKNETLPLPACTTCAFYSDKEMPVCALGNSVGVKCASHLYNPLLLVNHSYKKVDVQNLYVEYDKFINCNSDMGFKPSLTSDEMYSHQKFDKESILDANLEAFKVKFGAKVVINDE